MVKSNRPIFYHWKNSDRKRTIKILFLVFFSIATISCAPISPPYVHNDKYYNPANNFSLKLPSSWEHRKEPPNWLENSVCVGEHKNLQAYFVNKDMKGVVQVSSSKTSLNLKKASDNYLSSSFNRSLIDTYYESLRKSLEKVKVQITNNRFIEDYSYSMYSYNLNNLPSKIIEARIKCNDKQELIRKELTTYVLLCDDNDTCFVTFSLISPISDFEKVQVSYIDIMRTLSNWSPSD
ncbi:MAG: hypothetical protein K0A94_11015 [Desulfuromonadales bacterium]|nr:hypothetical protein [Desulfuromonadales bacterium]